MMKTLRFFFFWTLLLPLLGIAQTMVINEVMFKPGPSTSGCDQKLAYPTTPTCGREYIEIYNSDCNNNFNLSGYVLASATTQGVSSLVDNGGSICFPPGTIVPAGSFLIVGGGNDHNAASNGTFDYAAGSFDIKVPNYIGTNYLCINTAGSSWFLANIDGWMALYEPSGAVHSAVYWSSNANNIMTVADFNYNPCSPTAYSGIQLKSARQIYQSTPALIQYMGNPSSIATGNTYSRIPDGGAFQVNLPKTIGPLRTDRCNDGSCQACGNLLLTSAPDTCNNHHGSITASIINQTTSPPPYTYQLSGTASSGPIVTSNNPYIFNNLQAGTYIVSVYDNFTPPNHTVDTVIVGNTGTLSISATNTTPDTCNGGNGTAGVTVSGSGSFSYTWNTTPAQHTQTATGLHAGQYIVTVTLGGCSTIDTLTVGSTGSLSIASHSTTPDTCHLGNGSATIVPSGTGPFTYSWNCIPPQTSQTASHLTAGQYVVTVTHAGCSVLDTLNVGNTGILSITAISMTPASCNASDGTATVTAAGGNGIFTYTWSTSPPQHTQTASNLAQGLYVVTVSSNGCSAIDTILVTGASGPTLVLYGNPEHCGKSDGTASVSASGGSGIYSYQWNTISHDTTASISHLAAGTYIVTVSDGGSCSPVDTLILLELPGPGAAVYPNPVFTQAGQAIAFTSTNNTGVIQWNWNYGDNTTAPNAGSVVSHAYANTGNYIAWLQIKDSFGCTDSIAIPVSVIGFHIPNIITPNGDGQNDEFKIIGLEEVPNVNLSIFNRWGKIVFESTYYKNDWDGGNCDDGVYFYVVKIPSISVESNGTITIIR